jgi:hypothetical protein
MVICPCSAVFAYVSCALINSEKRILRDIAIYDFLRSTSPEPLEPCLTSNAKPYLSAEMMAQFLKLMDIEWLVETQKLMKAKDPELFYSLVHAYFSTYDMRPTTFRQRLGHPSSNEVIAEFSYTGKWGELSFEKGEIISVSEKTAVGGWWTGRIGDRRGRVPS